jgi:hypothetical protein
VEIEMLRRIIESVEEEEEKRLSELRRGVELSPATAVVIVGFDTM